MIFPILMLAFHSPNRNPLFDGSTQFPRIAIFPGKP